MQWKSANVLFADVKGYSTLSNEQMKTFAEDILPKLEHSLEDLSIIDRNTWGDGIVILSERTSDVCEAAFGIRDVFRNIHWSRFKLPKLDIRISIHHGEYLAGHDSFTGRAIFCGHSIVIAARLEPIVPAGRIWISRTAAAMLSDYQESERRSHAADDFFRMESIGPVTLPKSYGQLEVHCLHRHNDDRLTDSEWQEIREAEHRRKDPSMVIPHLVVLGVVLHGQDVLMVQRNENAEHLDCFRLASTGRPPTRRSRSRRNFRRRPDSCVRMQS